MRRLKAPKALTEAMAELWECSNEEGFSEDRCADLADRIKRIEDGVARIALECAGLWRSAHGYLEAEIACREPNWRTVKALHRVWSESLAWSKAGAV